MGVDANVQSLAEIIIIILVVLIAIKLIIFICKKILIPSIKFVWKLIVILSIVVFFIGLYVMKEAVLSSMSEPMQYLVIVVLAIIAAVNYLKKRGNSYTDTQSKDDD